MQPVVDIRGLTKRFGEREVLRGLDLAVPAGVCFGVLGPNGAGKTTTLRALLGLSPGTSGEIRVFGLPIPAQGRAVRARCGVVPQADNLDPDFTVIENLRVYARYFGLTGAPVEERIRELLGFVELSDRADAPIATLSGGMKRRLTIARALINRPELIILDEPTMGLSITETRKCLEFVTGIKGAGKSAIFIDHNIFHVHPVADRIIVLDRGAVAAQFMKDQISLDGLIEMLSHVARTGGLDANNRTTT